MEYMHHLRFQLAQRPTQLIPYLHLANANNPGGFYPCLRDRFICPDQARYFGDKGSAVVFMEPLGGSLGKARAAEIAPYGWMAVWRMWTSDACDGGCANREDILPPGVQSLPSVFAPTSLYCARSHHVPSSPSSVNGARGRTRPRRASI